VSLIPGPKRGKGVQNPLARDNPLPLEISAVSLNPRFIS
jgi:hypothetical protein